jgi:hypothetical protein
VAGEIGLALEHAPGMRKKQEMTNMKAVSNPFARHMSLESPPEPAQPQPVVEAAAVDPTEAPVVEPCLPSKPIEAPAARTRKVFGPFASHASEKKPNSLIRLNRAHEAPPAQRLMAWLPRWPKATISVRDVRLYGPNSLRDPKIAADAIEVLASYGWLAPVEGRQHNSKWWEIARGPDQAVASPGVAEP